MRFRDTLLRLLGATSGETTLLAPATSGGNLTLPSGNGTILKDTYTPDTQTSTPANPTGTAAASTLKMMGCAVSFTATKNGVTDVHAHFVMGGPSGGNPICQLRRGTGTAPLNGDAATGTLVGNAETCVLASATELIPGDNIGTVTLTAGTTYWFDFALGNFGLAGTVSIVNCVLRFVEF